jgi:hypothetical protein
MSLGLVAGSADYAGRSDGHAHGQAAELRKIWRPRLDLGFANSLWRSHQPFHGFLGQVTTVTGNLYNPTIHRHEEGAIRGDGEIEVPGSSQAQAFQFGPVQDRFYPYDPYFPVRRCQVQSMDFIGTGKE